MKNPVIRPRLLLHVFLMDIPSLHARHLATRDNLTPITKGKEEEPRQDRSPLDPSVRRVMAFFSLFSFLFSFFLPRLLL
ncbi:hypothetical protein BO70DRAFT_140337 [Aspergillus heteromorphus CBS 117.55]|uniref:Stress-associated endoplasmic reticulum protein n=1 Tax=Aspergillus heteromorphus CBS 117.55 TaxID=1448321 RepID=A0A317V7U4_9EURO|nr:uncharacterized protein BO70DRAFT_140337 [Aspergillus heteromorphus CBS 117.55]PWY70186.1 hypothetical protein BO70DRAFT_140337 [Aspergillus heteromorphus CBS 117.55]